ncbi:hypothetical protein [Halorussus caseinilyticus]|uniref:Uncharacterized protein n=1 Tax=Halorussus caseinilyticus TaxID=3034025 RepID=A0ABD5WM72_9EURY
MRPGTVYEVVWVNLDGVEHELRVFDGNDEEVVSTSSSSAVGASRSVVFKRPTDSRATTASTTPRACEGR